MPPIRPPGKGLHYGNRSSDQNNTSQQPTDCTDKDSMNYTRWHCFSTDLWNLLPKNFDQGWYAEFPINRRYMKLNVLKRDWFNSICHLVIHRVSPCARPYEEKCSDWKREGTGTNCMLHALRHLCSMTYQAFSHRVSEVLKCNKERDELSLCFAPFFYTDSAFFLISGGRSSIEWAHSRENQLAMMTWLLDQNARCVQDV